ncbi:DUF2513 domain-containing protein [Lactobacillus sp. M0396]|uniref:DUF2513 domain-containing protein n=1 Tax=Lactobacillus sp. M0396 TaxID=2751030 RepID=UPI0018DB1DC2|nr:DUF2513 domain-containing protein [Lactobacillus sp. M0396]MBI0032763.1 DUF2513 domain-containing protein [Lactobacillus sp. M0396]
MELNYDLVRDILIEYAQSEHASGPTAQELIVFAAKKECSYDELTFTLARMYEGGLITNPPQLIGNSYKITEPGNLTWQGNEYLNSVRTQNVWNEAKNKIKELGLKVSFETIAFLAKSIVAKKLGLS